MHNAAAGLGLFAYVHNNVCVRVEALTQAGVSDSVVRNCTRLGSKSVSFKDETDSRRVWLVLESLPLSVQERIAKHFGDIRLQVLTKLVLDAVVLDTDPLDVALFDFLPAAKQRELVAAAGVLRFLADAKRHRFVVELGCKSGELAEVVSVLLKAGLLTGLSCKHPKALQRKVMEFKQCGPQCLVHKNVGNKCAQKDKKDKVEQWFVTKYGAPTKPDLSDLYDLYNREVRHLNEWPAYSYETVREMVMKPVNRDRWMAARHGKKHYTDTMTPTLVRRAIDAPDKMWSLDGTTLQLYAVDRNGKLLKKPWYVYLCFDFKTRYIVGAALDRTERTSVVVESLNDATTKRGVVPRYIQFDHGSANLAGETTRILRELGVVVLPTAVGNSKGNKAELALRWFEGKMLRGFENFVGGNITAGLESRANPDLLKHLLNTGKMPSEEQVREQFWQAVAEWNSVIEEAYSGVPSGGKRFDAALAATAFWTLWPHRVLYGQDGIEIQINGRLYRYVVEDAPGVESVAWRKEWLGTRFGFRYNPMDFNRAFIYDAQDKFVCEVVQKHEFGAVPDEWQEGEGVTLREIMDKRKRMADESLSEFEELLHNVAAEAGYLLANKDDLNAGLAGVEAEVNGLGPRWLDTNLAQDLLNGNGASRLDPEFL